MLNRDIIVFFCRLIWEFGFQFRRNMIRSRYGKSSSRGDELMFGPRLGEIIESPPKWSESSFNLYHIISKKASKTKTTSQGVTYHKLPYNDLIKILRPNINALCHQVPSIGMFFTHTALPLPDADHALPFLPSRLSLLPCFSPMLQHGHLGDVVGSDLLVEVSSSSVWRYCRGG